MSLLLIAGLDPFRVVEGVDGVVGFVVGKVDMVLGTTVVGNLVVVSNVGAVVDVEMGGTSSIKPSHRAISSGLASIQLMFDWIISSPWLTVFELPSALLWSSRNLMSFWKQEYF